MTDFLKQIETGKKQKPRRCLLYGIQGIGKSTWASQAPAPIFLQTEDGLDDIGVDRFKMAKSLPVVMDMLRELYGEHKYKTLVIDSLDWLEKLIWDVTVEENKNIKNSKPIKSIEDFDYYKGYKFALKHWAIIKNSLNFLRDDKNMNIILISHAKIEKLNLPDQEPYDRYSPKIQKDAAALFCEWVDEVFFANFKVNVIKLGKGFDEKAKGTGEGSRVIYTNERPCYIAKNRLGITEELEMKFSAYGAHFNNKTKKPVQRETEMAAFLSPDKTKKGDK